MQKMFADLQTVENIRQKEDKRRKRRCQTTQERLLSQAMEGERDEDEVVVSLIKRRKYMSCLL